MDRAIRVRGVAPRAHASHCLPALPVLGAHAQPGEVFGIVPAAGGGGIVGLWSLLALLILAALHGCRARRVPM